MKPNYLNNFFCSLNNNLLIKKYTLIFPVFSKFFLELISFLEKEGCIKKKLIFTLKNKKMISLVFEPSLEYSRIISPKLEFKKKELLSLEKRFLPSPYSGLLIISCAKGLVSQKKLKELNIGGILLGYII